MQRHVARMVRAAHGRSVAVLAALALTVCAFGALVLPRLGSTDLPQPLVVVQGASVEAPGGLPYPPRDEERSTAATRPGDCSGDSVKPDTGSLASTWFSRNGVPLRESA